MRTWALTFSVAAAVAYAASSHPNPIPLRKSLSFGPRLDHATYTTSPAEPLFSTTQKNHHCHDVARDYVRNVLKHPEGSFVVRPDSYRDSVTGVEHVYLRQILGGVEVADGDINLNILDGKVISYGDSFYRGPVPTSDFVTLSTDAQDHAYHCAQLRAALATQMSSDTQLPLSVSMAATHSNRLTKLYEHNCLSLHSLDPDHFASVKGPGPVADAATAALYFMAASHPSPKVAESILHNFKSHKDKISSSFTHHLHDKNGASIELLDNVPHTESPVKARLVFVQSPCDDKCADGVTSKVSLVWRLEVEMQDNWYEASIDATMPSRIITVVDWVSDSSGHSHTERTSKCWPGTMDDDDDDDALPNAQKPRFDQYGIRETLYKVWPWGSNDPDEGARKVLKTPYDRTASPLGWHAIPSSHNPALKDEGPGYLTDRDGVCNFTTTWGNNVQAQENWEGRNHWVKNYRPESKNMTFVYGWGASHKHDGEEIAAKKYIDLVLSQLFYTTNMVHDLYYRYGFDEVAGNFQNYNFGKGGKEDDAVIAHAQDGSGMDNANFATPPDGTRGKMRMYVWDTAHPYRDGDLEAGIVIHELSHGLSTRLTGGPANSGCLGWGESGGMGEGWGDFLATTIRSTSNYTDYAMGAWAANQAKGIRNYVYSTNITVNPSTYKILDGPGYWGVHAIGEVWAEILWVVSQRLITKHGFSDTLFPPNPLADGSIPEPNDFYRPISSLSPKRLIPKHGNTLMVQLVLSGMKLQPCRPSFFDARNAIIQADEVLTGGENFCDLWKGFAERGLGPDAKIKNGTPWGGGIRKNDYEPPVKCGGKKHDGDDDDS